METPDEYTVVLRLDRPFAPFLSYLAMESGRVVAHEGVDGDSFIPIGTGPYRFVRHPAYATGIVSFILTPILLGSLWALIPCSLVALVTVIRTALEDRALLEELDGYQDYAQQVRYRLLPGIW